MVYWWFVLIVLLMTAFVFLLSDNVKAGYIATTMGLLSLIPMCVIAFKLLGGWEAFSYLTAAWYEQKSAPANLDLYFMIIGGYLLLLVIVLVARSRTDFNFRSAAGAAAIYFVTLIVFLTAGFAGWAKHDALAVEKMSRKYRPASEEIDESAVDKFGIPIPANYNPPVIYHFEFAPEHVTRQYALLFEPDYRGTIYHKNRYRQGSGTKKWQTDMDNAGRDIARGLLDAGYTVYFCEGEEQSYYGTQGQGPRQTYPLPTIAGIRSDATVMFVIRVESPVLDPAPWIEVSIFTRNTGGTSNEIKQKYKTEQVTDANSFKALRLTDG